MDSRLKKQLLQMDRDPDLYHSFSLSNSHLKKFPDRLKNYTHLTSINLSNNQIEVIPDWIGSFNKLRTLDLSKNIINKIPDSIGNLKNLEIFDLSSNIISVIPKSINKVYSRKKPKLFIFNISKNPIKNLSSLKYSIFPYVIHRGLDLTHLPKTVKRHMLKLQPDVPFASPELRAEHFRSLDMNGIINEIRRYYKDSIKKIFQKYIKNPKNIQKIEHERLVHECGGHERDILELYVPKDDRLLLELSNKLRIKLSNDFEISL